MRLVKFGVVGAGNIFIGAHLPGYRLCRNAVIKAIADLSEARREYAYHKVIEAYEDKIKKLREAGEDLLAREVKSMMDEFKVYSSYEEMISKEGDLDVVDICLPHRYHVEVAIASLKAGFHTMTEKPMARNYFEALKLVEAVKKTKKYYQYNENWFFDIYHYSLKKILTKGALGEVLFISYPAGHGGPENRTWFWEMEASGGGSLIDNGVHAIGGVWYLLGLEEYTPEAVKSLNPIGISIRIPWRMIRGVPKKVKVEDDAHIAVWFDNVNQGGKASSMIEGSWSYVDAPRFMIVGSMGYLTVEKREGNTAEAKIVSGEGEYSIEIPVDPFSGFRGEIENMCYSVIDNQKPFSNESVGSEIQAIMDAAYLSEIWGRRKVTMSEFKDFSEDFMKKHGEKAANEFLKMKMKHLIKRT